MKKKSWILSLILAACCLLLGCSENYSNGSRVGYITQFSKTGIFFKTWEGHLNMSQTGANSSQEWDFGVDRQNTPQDACESMISRLALAQNMGYKVKLDYHEVWGLSNVMFWRGETSYYLTGVTILDQVPPPVNPPEKQ